MQKFLVGVDASPVARAVLAQAVDLAGRTGARLVLFRAVGVPVELPMEAYVMPPDTLPDMLQKEARRGLEHLAASVPPELLSGVRVGIGSAWQAICEAAREENADLIVIGSHGYGMLDRLVGTTAARVVNHADRSVLVVRTAEMAAV